VDFEPDHPGDFCEEYECVDCGRTGQMVIEHYRVANEYSTVQEFGTRTRYTGVLRESRRQGGQRHPQVSEVSVVLRSDQREMAV
jgi:hypothetical protein